MSDEDEVRRCSDRDEAALRDHDVAVLNELLSTDASVVTFRRVGSLAPGVVAVGTFDPSGR